MQWITRTTFQNFENSKVAFIVISNKFITFCMPWKARLVKKIGKKFSHDISTRLSNHHIHSIGALMEVDSRPFTSDFSRVRNNGLIFVILELPKSSCLSLSLKARMHPLWPIFSLFHRNLIFTPFGWYETFIWRILLAAFKYKYQPKHGFSALHHSVL